MGASGKLHFVPARVSQILFPLPRRWSHRLSSSPLTRTNPYHAERTHEQSIPADVVATCEARKLRTNGAALGCALPSRPGKPMKHSLHYRGTQLAKSGLSELHCTRDDTLLPALRNPKKNR